MLRIAHLADIHIRAQRYMDEIEYTFDQLYESLEKYKPRLIVICGDTYHSKITVTSEYFNCAQKFFRTLSDKYPIITILGNHDLALDNRHRMNAIEPVINSLGMTKYPIELESRETRWNNKFVFHTLSILDDKKDWPNQDTILEGLESGKYKEDDIHIALYHGSVNHSMVDSGWISRGNKDDIDIFSGFDYAMLGDIHKYQMLTPRIAYPGSLRQNNYGEDLDKGYLIWDIESKEEYSTKRVVLPQKRHFYTINLDPTEPIPTDLGFKKDSRIRVKLTDRIGISDELKIRSEVKRIYKPCNAVELIPPDDGIKLDDLQVNGTTILQENLRNLEVQRELIKDFFKNDKLEEETLNAIFRIDEKYNSYIDKNVARNVIWDIKKFKWENIFSYGNKNEIDFTKINGLVGVFGPNMIGKALSLKTEIPTPGGWTTIKNIRVGDFVFAPDGSPTKVLAKSPIFNNHVCYKVIFSDESEVVADADHLWTVEDHFSRAKNGNIFQTLTTRQLKKTLFWRESNDNQGSGHEWSINTCSPVKYKRKKLEIEPYVLGCWLGDGTSSSGGFTCGDNEIIENLKSVVGENIVKHNCKNNDYHYNIKKLIPKLRKLNLLNNKHIPLQYLQSDVQDRELLLSGLLDTDGYCSDKGVVEFTNTNKILANQTYELITSLGYKATFKVKDAKLNGKFISKKYCIYFSPNKYVFRLKRKNEKIKIDRSQEINRRFIVDIQEIKREPVQCLVVEHPSHLFLITKSFIPTHNSSIFDALCYTFFDKINKENANKNEDFINNRKKKCSTSIVTDFAGTPVFIERSTKKRNKAPTLNEINFYKKVKNKSVSLNGERKPDTNKKIRDKFGTLEDFNTTSLSSQEGLLQFLHKGGTDKKKLFAKFLDLIIFEQKFKLADAEFDKIKTKVKESEEIDFHKLITESKDKIGELEELINIETQERTDFEKQLEDVNDRIINQSSKIKDVEEDLSFNDIVERIFNNDIELSRNKKRLEELSAIVDESQDLWGGLDDHIKELENIEKKLDIVKEVENDLVHLKSEAKLLEKVPCGDQFPTCSFIVKAHRAKGELRNFDETRLEARKDLEQERLRLKKLIDEIKNSKNIISEIENLKLVIENLNLKQDSLQKRKKHIEENQNIIEQNHELITQIKQLKSEKDKLLLKLGEYNKSILTQIKQLGTLEERLDQTLEEQKHIESLRQEYHYYQLYLKAMGKNGISYNIISQRIPLINIETNRILSQVCDLSLIIENNEDKKSIDMYITSNDKGKRIVELGSGFEKTMISLALRAALWNVSSLPKTPMLILDEPFGFIEVNKFMATIRMLKYLKNYFKHIFIISHDENLKSEVDSAIYIRNNDEGYAQCEVK